MRDSCDPCLAATLQPRPFKREMASSIRILSSTDVDKILSQLDIVQLIDVHTPTLFRTLALANLANLNPNPNPITNTNTAPSKPDGSNPTNQIQITDITDPGPFVHSPHRLAVQAGSSATSPGGGRGGRGKDQGGLYTTLVMPSSVANYGTTVKLVSLPNPIPNPAPALAFAPAPAPAPTHTTHTSRGLPATTVVVDERTGAVKTVVNARALNIRTALGKLVLSGASLFFLFFLFFLRGVWEWICW